MMPPGIPVMGLTVGSYKWYWLWVWLYCLLWWLVQDALKVATHTLLLRFNWLGAAHSTHVPMRDAHEFDDARHSHAGLARQEAGRPQAALLQRRATAAVELAHAAPHTRDTVEAAAAEAAAAVAPDAPCSADQVLDCTIVLYFWYTSAPPQALAAPGHVAEAVASLPDPPPKAVAGVNAAAKQLQEVMVALKEEGLLGGREDTSLLGGADRSDHV